LPLIKRYLFSPLWGKSLQFTFPVVISVRLFFSFQYGLGNKPLRICAVPRPGKPNIY